MGGLVLGPAVLVVLAVLAVLAVLVLCRVRPARCCQLLPPEPRPGLG
ncbi:hypothetical protein GCM10020360_32670 [Nonlabens tegetincola]